MSRSFLASGAVLLLAALIATAHAAGEPDGSFGVDGIAIADLGTPTDRVAAIAVTPAGRIVVAGDVAALTGRDLVIAAFLPSGAPDPSFAGTGRVTADFGGDETASGLAIHRDGSIVVIGTRQKDGHLEVVLLRYLENGALDASFNGNGRRVLAFTDAADNLGSGIALELDGRIVVGGTRTTPTGSVFAVARLWPDGTLDSTFNGSGKRFIDFGLDKGTNASGAAVAIQDDRKIVIAGTRLGASGSSDFAVARLAPDGSFDTTFDGSGKTAIDFAGTEVAHAIAIRPDGYIAVAGVRNTATGADFAVAVLRDDGQLDTTFEGNGKATIDLGADETAYGIVAQPDGKLVVAGERRGTTGSDFAVVRYQVDGTPDPTLDGDGELRIDLTPGSDAAAGVALQEDGRIVVAGTVVTNGMNDLGLVRLLSTPAIPRGFLEIPSPGSHQSGIGLVSGWLCDAPSVTVRIDGNPAFATAYGTTRTDTATVCGDSNNGFGLLFNWGLLSDGPHIIRALARGQEFGKAVFEVTTLGTPFLTGASGTFTLPGFPQAGESVELAWVEGLQHFVLRNFAKAGTANAESVALSPSAPAAASIGVLENPTPDSFQSGISVISGWVCNAKNVQIRLDTQPAIRAGYGTQRDDTQPVCGDANNGFGLLFNWSLLDDGVHTVEARADGALIGTATFTVTTLGSSFLRGASGTYTLADFPQAGKSVDVSWDEGQQNFVIVRRR